MGDSFQNFFRFPKILVDSVVTFVYIYSHGGYKMSMIGSGLKTWKVRKHNFSYDAFHSVKQSEPESASVIRERHHRYTIAHAAGQDAGNRSMKAAGRVAWNADDWSVAVAEETRLLGNPA